MKETMNITYHQFKLLSMLLKSIGAALPNEYAVRAVHKNITKGEVEIKKKIFENSKGSAEHELDAAFIGDLPIFVYKMLDKHDENKSLTWHNGTIPENEIWVKLEDDHGKDSFKMAFHNLKRPNSKFNTHLIASKRT